MELSPGPGSGPGANQANQAAKKGRLTGLTLGENIKEKQVKLLF